MPKVGFFVQDAKVSKKGMTSIKAIVSIKTLVSDANEPKYMTKQVSKNMGRVKPHHWHKSNQRVRPNRAAEKYNDYKEINNNLEQFEIKVNSFINSCIEDGKPLTVELIKRLYDGKIDHRAKVKKKSIWTAYNEYIESKEIVLEKNTIRGHRTTINYLLRFEDEAGVKISFESITLGFFDKWKDYHLKKRQLHWNYLETHVNRFSAFLTWSHERGYHNNLHYKKFDIAEKQGTSITVSINDFKKLYRHEFKNERLEKVRDIFCIGCYTGLRISDLMRLTRDSIQSINGKDFIVSYMKKVKKNVPLYIPLQPEAIPIIEKYKNQYSLLPKISDQKFNDYIKEVALEVGLTDKVKIMSFKTGVGVEREIPFNEIVHAHMTRNAFITFSIERDVPQHEVKEATGITSDKTLQRYIKKDLNRLSEKFERLSGLLDD